PWARVRAALAPAPALFFSAMLFSMPTMKFEEGDVLPMLVSFGFTYGVLPLAIGIAAIRSVRNKLFFRLDVSERELRKLWDVMRNNPHARYAFWLSLLGLVLAGLSLV